MGGWHTHNVIRRHPVLSALTGVYLGGLAWMTLTPMPFETKRASVIEIAVAGLHRYPVTNWVTTAGFEVAIKVAIFVPFGLLLVLLAGRRRWVLVVFVGVLTSCWIELAQSIWIPSRAADGRDVLANSAGVLVGALLAVALISLADRRAHRPVPAAASRSLTPVSQSPASRL